MNIIANQWGHAIRKFVEDNGGNRTVMALSFARLGDGVGNSLLFVVIPLYVAQLPSPLFPLPEPVRVGILISWFGIVNSLVQPFMGALTDHFNKRKIFIQAGLLLMVISSLLYVVARQYVDMLIFRSLQGLGIALTVPAAIALLVTSSKKRTRGGTMGIYTVFRMIGLAIGPLLGGFMYDQFGFDAVFYMGAAFISIGIILVQMWVKDLPAPRPDPPQPPKKRKSIQILDLSLLSPGILGAAFASFMMAGAFSMMTTLEQQFNERLGMTAFGFAIAFSSMTVTRMIFQVPLGRLSDRIGRKPPIIAGLLLMAPATVFLGYVASSGMLIVTRLVQGLASAAIAAPAFAVAGDLTRRGGEGQQMSYITVGFGFGIAFGPLVAGLLAGFSFELPFVVIGSFCLVAAWIVLHFVPETVQKEEKQRKEEAAEG